MEIVQWIVILLAIAFIFSRFMPAKGVENITSSDAKQKMKDRNIQFIDVRTPGEFKAKNRKPFKNIPLSNLAGQTKQLDKSKEVVVICQSGMRSTKAAKMLKKQGFEKVSNVKGGMSAWV
ncbi:rhodanese-like domain-containing protein [Virgibacillus halodenitrificans]|uniref:rhodanese-like domain-containing protein n=1 Tax=Virgibacillus TaxID=84406 RepID=UPI00045C783E|nr:MULTISPECIES: rhodanese-like domain-containing protein [Virgibacillus]AIF44889.1 sulfurtransferase [Virgibacillus sp. SK37]MCG1027721.1 rhodanese-like domain-containing protein [Virgibacillus halodenitrificans]MEC2157776.1 rhodanese-like domain-containing protein [Virgibacillus halodenitrificans]CDQ31796.1 Thiosulfate sulfurtransferase GlpE [Virgibacillus halodenitrificans]